MMRLRSTLRLRFALWTAGLLLAALVVFGVFVYVRLARNLAAAIDDSLRLSAAQTIAAVDVENGHITFSDSIPKVSTLDSLHTRDVTIRVLDTSGRTIQTMGSYHAQPVIPADVARARQYLSSFTTLDIPSSRAPTRWYTAPIITNNQLIGIVQVAQSLDSVHDTLEQLQAALYYQRL